MHIAHLCRHLIFTGSFFHKCLCLFAALRTIFPGKQAGIFANHCRLMQITFFRRFCTFCKILCLCLRTYTGNGNLTGSLANAAYFHIFRHLEFLICKTFMKLFHNMIPQYLGIAAGFQSGVIIVSPPDHTGIIRRISCKPRISGSLRCSCGSGLSCNWHCTEICQFTGSVKHNILHG